MANRISQDRFKALPRSRELVQIGGQPWMMPITDDDGKVVGEHRVPRWHWVYTVTLELIATMSPGARYNLLRDGFFHFQQALIPAFNAKAPSPLAWYEVRAVWDGIVEYQQRYEWHLLAGFELMRDRERRRNSFDGLTFQQELDAERVTDDSPEVEAIRDGGLRRVR